MPYKDPEKQKEYSRNEYNRLKDNPTYKEKGKQRAVKYYLKNKENYKIKYQNNRQEIINRTRRNKIKRLFGITIEDYNELREKQDYKCLICGRLENPKKKLCIDHCHTSKKIRGLLCSSCNYNLRWYEKCQEKIENYLKNN